jgi:hypothetical protein
MILFLEVLKAESQRNIFLCGMIVLQGYEFIFSGIEDDKRKTIQGMLDGHDIIICILAV